MTYANRTIAVITLLLVPAFLIAAGPSDEERGWSFSQRLQGSSNAAGVVLKTNSTATYRFNRLVEAYAGVPVYFARETSAAGAAAQFMNGMGNVYSGLFVSARNSAIHYSSDLVVTAPTGDRSRGFSTGHPTVDWTNTFSHAFATVTPYASIGAANTISDTSFFVRPFSSKGVVAHYELGALFDVAPRVSIGSSGYGVRATGEQEIISKVVEQEQPAPQQSGSGGVLSTITKVADLTRVNSGNGRAVFETQRETLGPAEVANDHGFSTWLTLRPTASTDFQVGYSRSMGYQFNSLFFGVGFRLGH